MSERERAEAFLDNGTAILKSWNEIFTELGMPSPTRRALIDDLLAFSREERARTYEEAAYYLEYRSSGPIPPDAIDHMKDCAKHMREEGGHDVDQGPSR